MMMIIPVSLYLWIEYILEFFSEDTLYPLAKRRILKVHVKWKSKWSIQKLKYSMILISDDNQ